MSEEQRARIDRAIEIALGLSSGEEETDPEVWKEVQKLREPGI